MRIGELARRTGVSARVLRYYEQQGLLSAERDANGYRRYRGEEAVEAVRKVRELLAAGLNTDEIRGLLPCAQGGGGLTPCALSAGIVERRMAQLESEMAELTRRRAALGAYAQVMRKRREEDAALATMALRSA
ncbi:MerR family transcriptional regulator [Streptomyces sp. N2A]|uniref:MerR family transcriptional regulator n=1 Tax=Streptomyces sp. N2A TaxID=3073936 RepID=UPI00286FC6F8|nr:MerR family transcriptional regulator [Streptomyces sp. N2A]